MPLAQTIGLEQLSEYFHMPINEVAKELGVCATVLKKICRKNGIPRWPHRKIKSIDKMIKTLESTEAKKAEDEDKIKQEIATLRHKKLFLMKNPNVLVKPNKNIVKQPKLTSSTSPQSKIRVGGASLQHLLQSTAETDVTLRRLTEYNNGNSFETPENSARRLLDVFASLQNKLHDQSESTPFPQPPQSQPQPPLALQQMQPQPHFGVPSSVPAQHFDIFAELNFQSHAPVSASVPAHNMSISALSQPMASLPMLSQQSMIQPISMPVSLPTQSPLSSMSMTIPQMSSMHSIPMPSTLSPQLPLSLPSSASFSLAPTPTLSPPRPDLNKSGCLELPKINDFCFSPQTLNLKPAALEPTPGLSSFQPQPLKNTILPPLRSINF